MTVLASQQGRFDVIQHLGSGGAGDVHLAYDRVLGRRVALKRLRSDTSAPHDALPEENGHKINGSWNYNIESTLAQLPGPRTEPDVIIEG